MSKVRKTIAIDEQVHFRAEWLDLPPQRKRTKGTGYALFGVVRHHGSAQAGHYTADVRLLSEDAPGGPERGGWCSAGGNAAACRRSNPTPISDSDEDGGHQGNKRRRRRRRKKPVSSHVPRESECGDESGALPPKRYTRVWTHFNDRRLCVMEGLEQDDKSQSLPFSVEPGVAYLLFYVRNDLLEWDSTGPL